MEFISRSKEEYIKRIHENVKVCPNTGCWLWQGVIGTGRYGVLALNNKSILAHRLSYLCFKGNIQNKMFVCHKCDNTLCINPEHLFLGTHIDNMKDMVNKNRQACGINHGLSKLNDDAVKHIKRLRTEGYTYPAIKQYLNLNISETSIHNVAIGKTWKHVK